MNVSRLLNMDAVVTNPETVDEETPRDDFGDPVPGSAASLTFKGWYEQTRRSEDTAGQDQQSETWRLFLEPAADGQISGSATVQIGGGIFEMDGPPWSATNPRTGALSHVEGTMKRVR